LNSRTVALRITTYGNRCAILTIAGAMAFADDAVRSLHLRIPQLGYSLNGSAFVAAHFAYDVSLDSFSCTPLINRFQRFFAAFVAAHFAYAERTALRT
jgi:hypothetical protein